MAKIDPYTSAISQVVSKKLVLLSKRLGLQYGFWSKSAACRTGQCKADFIIILAAKVFRYLIFTFLIDFDTKRASRDGPVASAKVPHWIQSFETIRALGCRLRASDNSELADPPSQPSPSRYKPKASARRILCFRRYFVYGCVRWQKCRDRCSVQRHLLPWHTVSCSRPSAYNANLLLGPSIGICRVCRW